MAPPIALLYAEQLGTCVHGIQVSYRKTRADLVLVVPRKSDTSRTRARAQNEPQTDAQPLLQYQNTVLDS